MEATKLGVTRMATKTISAPAPNAPFYTTHKWSTKRFFSFEYLQYLPKNLAQNEKYPLVLFLHGAGERGNDVELVTLHGLFKNVKQGMQFPFICVAPQCPAGKYWGCYTESLLAFLDELCATLPVDKNRVYVTGLSMGGTGTFMLGMADPDRFAALAPICGSGICWNAYALKDVPVLMYHGDCDDSVPIQESVTMLTKINKVGGSAALKILYGAGHNVWDYAYNDEEFFRWLLSHKKNRPQ